MLSMRRAGYTNALDEMGEAHLWKRALWRVPATSAAQYLKSTGRSRSAEAARCSLGSTSGASASPRRLHSPCTHL